MEKTNNSFCNQDEIHNKILKHNNLYVNAQPKQRDRIKIIMIAIILFKSGNMSHKHTNKRQTDKQTDRQRAKKDNTQRIQYQMF